MRREEDILREEGKVRVMGGCTMETEKETEWREGTREVQVTWRRSVGQGTELYITKSKDICMCIP